jgi:protein phosphatase
MGTTLVGGIFKNGRAALGNVGDSRAYLLTDGVIEQVTRDHSLAEELVRSGELTREQAKKYPQKNVITRALGVDRAVKCDIFSPETPAGARLLLCSDGLYNTASDGEILGVSMAFADVETACEELIKLALLRGAPDNVTVVILEF